MPSHPDRVRRNYPEMHCNHLWIFINQSNIAPFIEKDTIGLIKPGDRTTIKECINCGLGEKYTRSQETFLKEIKNHLL